MIPLGNPSYKKILKPCRIPQMEIKTILNKRKYIDHSWALLYCDTFTPVVFAKVSKLTVPFCDSIGMKYRVPEHDSLVFFYCDTLIKKKLCRLVPILLQSFCLFLFVIDLINLSTYSLERELIEPLMFIWKIYNHTEIIGNIAIILLKCDII